MSFEEKFTTLMAEHDLDPAAKQAFQEDPVSALMAADIPPVALTTPPTLTTHPKALAESVAQISIEDKDISTYRKDAGESEHISVRTRWWGVDIVMNQKLTQDVIDGLPVTGGLAALVVAAFAATGIITGGSAAVIGAGVAAIFEAKIAEIKIINKGKGVHWPISWLQWGILLAAVPTGPVGIVGAGLVFVHPLRR